MGNLSPIMKAIGARVTTQTKDRFRSQGPAPSGPPWEALKAATRKGKKHPKILTETTALRDSIHYRLTGRSAVSIGTGEHIPYAAIHQYGGVIRQGARSEIFARNRYVKGDRKGQFKKGTKAGRGFTINEHIVRIPARPFLGLSEENSREILGIINEYIASR